MTKYIQRIFAQNNPMRVLVSRLSAEKRPARFLLSRILKMTKLYRLLHIQRTGYVLKFHPASLAMALWVDPHHNRSDSEAIRGLLREGDSYVDVGANIGHLTIEAAFAVGDTGKITAFEAHPRTAEYLRENVELNNVTGVHVAQLAVGDAFRWVTFSDMDADDQNKVLPKGRGMMVPMVRLDAFFAGEAITLLKVDVEGWEKFVFLGAGQVLENVSFIYFECWDEHFRASGYSFLDIYDILSSRGFAIASVENGELLPIQRDHTFPKCVNLFAFRDMEKFAVRMGLRMSNSPLFTVFTATYNRAYTLPRVYESLKRQTLRDFEWLVVDDGSVDNTRQLVQAWCGEADFPIRYIWQEHAHKKVAFNRGVREAWGELFLNLDSDDEALPEALDTLKQVWGKIPKNDRHRYSAVTALCVDPAGNIVGSRFPADILDSNSIETSLRYRIRGEKWGFQRVDVLREFPFPEHVVGLVPEAVVWYRIAQKYLTRYVNVPLRVYHPGQDSLTAGVSDSHMRSDGRALLAREILEHHWRWGLVDPAAIFKEAVAYTCFSMHLASSQGGKRWPLKGVVPRLLVALMWPVGFVRYHLDNRRSGRG